MELTYQFGYARSARGSCKKCRGGIGLNELKVGKEKKSGFHDGITVDWNHFNCVSGNNDFTKRQLTKTKGWYRLRWEDLELVRETINDDLEVEKEVEEKAKQMNERFWEVKDEIQEVQPKILKELMSENGFEFSGKDVNEMVLDAASDMLAFGKLGKCPECGNKTLSNHFFKIVCHGHLNEYSKCEFETTDFSTIKRYPCVISDKLKGMDKKKILENFEFGEDYPTGNEEGEEGSGEEKPMEEDIAEDIIEDDLVLRGMKVIICGTARNLGSEASSFEEIVVEMGGEVTKTPINATVCFTSDADIEKLATQKIKDAKASLTCLRIEYLEKILSKEEGFMKLRTREGASEYLCEGCEWKTEIVYRKYHKKYEIQKETFKPTDDCDLMKVHPDNSLGFGTKVVLENDPVYGWTAYNVMMSKTDIDSGKNSVYQMQIVQNKAGTKYQMLFEWGRIGETTHNTFRNGPLETLKVEWIKKFKDCTGNEWADRLNFKKKGGKYYMQKLDNGKDEKDAASTMSEEMKKKLEEKRAMLMEKAKEAYLDERVRNLVEMIFDTDMMKVSLKNQGLNLEQMPLGKIRLDQMKEAMSVLSKLSDVISPECELNEKQKMQKIKEHTQHFYTLVPHVLRGEIPLIDDDEKVKKELQLVQTLCDVGEAMKLIEEDEDVDLDKMTKIYANYKKLNTEIVALDKESERYKLIEEMFMNNQETSHWSGATKVADIFEIERAGERERFQPHADDDNRQLLYHGSRLTNFVGILSTGLRIAPPEAPCNGYRYGKGLYFANCASKSVSYCTTNNDKRGCMLLCDVALGRQWKTPKDKYMEKPQPGSDSTYALGMVEPDPADTIKLEDGLQLNTGKIISTGLTTWNSHSELIVYDVARVTIRYLVIFQK